VLILSAGKGGSGKTTVTAQLLSTHVRKGGHAVGLDCDTNQALHRQFAGAAEPAPLIEAIEEHKQTLYGTNNYIDDPLGAPKSTPPSPSSPLFHGASPRTNPLVAAAHAVQDNGVVSMRTGELPPEEQLNHCNHFLIGAGLRFGLHTVTATDELIVADMMAGNDNATSGMPSIADGAFVVVEPTAESVDAYRQITSAYEQLSVPNIVVVANQVEDDDDLAFITDRVHHHVACVIPRDKQFFRSLSDGEHPELPAHIAGELDKLHEVVSGWTPEAPEAKYRRAVTFHNSNYPDATIPPQLAESAGKVYGARVRRLRGTTTRQPRTAPSRMLGHESRKTPAPGPKR
jgi:CO dehydrogenase nickel-insertion accessory protein CooC1